MIEEVKIDSKKNKRRDPKYEQQKGFEPKI